MMTSSTSGPGWSPSVRVVIATVLSVALPGSGSFYLGGLSTACGSLALVTVGSLSAALLWRFDLINAWWLVVLVGSLTLLAHGGGSLAAAFEASRSRHKRSFLMSVAFMLVVALGMYGTQELARRLIMASFVIVTIAMEPTIEHGDRILVEPHDPSWTYQRGQIVAFHDSDRDENFVRRLIGLPGDHVEIHGSEVLVNGQSLRQGPCSGGPMGCFVEHSADGLLYRVVDRQGDGRLDLQVEVDPGRVFVMRDRRDLSIPLNPLPRSWLIGRVRDVWWSYGHAGVNLGRFGLHVEPEPKDPATGSTAEVAP